VGDRRNEAMMLNNTGYLRRMQGRWDEAEDFHLRSLAIREEIGDRVGAGRNYGMLTAVFMAKGQLDQAREAAEKALAIARETKDRLYEGTSLAQLGDVQLALGDQSAARQSYTEGRSVFEAIEDTMRVLQSDLKLAELDLDEGRTDVAEATALTVLDQSRALNLIQPEIEAMELIGDIYYARQDLPGASAEYAAALERVRESSWAGKEHSLLIKQAGVLLDLGEPERAAPLIGAISGQEQDLASLRVQARFAFVNGSADRAVEFMQAAQEVAGGNWNEESESELEHYLEVAKTQ
jgi:predicted negative regulator of RcsB-dependent stress response